MPKSVGSRVEETSQPAPVWPSLILLLGFSLGTFAGWKYYTRPYKVGDVIHHRMKAGMRAIIVAPGVSEGHWDLRFESDMQFSKNWAMDEWERD